MSVEIAVIAGLIMIICGRFMGRFYEDPKVWILLYVPSLVFAWAVATVVREPFYSFLDEFGFELWFPTLCYILLILGLGYLSVKITEFVSRDEDVERSKDKWNRKTEMTHVTNALKPTIESLKNDVDGVVTPAKNHIDGLIQAAQRENRDGRLETQGKIRELGDVAENLAEKADAIKKTPDIIDDILKEGEKTTEHLGRIEASQKSLSRELKAHMDATAEAQMPATPMGCVGYEEPTLEEDRRRVAEKIAERGHLGTEIRNKYILLYGYRNGKICKDHVVGIVLIFRVSRKDEPGKRNYYVGRKKCLLECHTAHEHKVPLLLLTINRLNGRECLQTIRHRDLEGWKGTSTDAKIALNDELSGRILEEDFDLALLFVRGNAGQ